VIIYDYVSSQNNYTVLQAHIHTYMHARMHEYKRTHARARARTDTHTKTAHLRTKNPSTDRLYVARGWSWKSFLNFWCPTEFSV